MAEPEAVAQRTIPVSQAAEGAPEADLQVEPLSAAVQAQVAKLRRGYMSLEERLTRLRQRSRRGARNATWLSSICSTLMLCLMLAVGVGMVAGWMVFGAAHVPSLPPLLRIVLQTEFMLIPPIILFALGRVIVQLLTAHRLFAHYYRDSLAYLTQGSEALLFAQEDFRQLLEEARERNIGSLGFFQPKERPRSFERQLEYSACYGLPLRRAAELKPVRGRLEYAWAQAVYKFQGVFNIPRGAWLATMAVGAVLPALFFMLTLQMIGHIAHTAGPPPYFMVLTSLLPLSTMLLVLPMGLGFQYAPRYLISRARLTALLDFLLEQPRVDPATLPAPAEPKGWWARQLAPWKCREKAPK